MDFAFSKIFWVVARPTTFLVLLCFAGALLTLLTELRWPRWLALIAAGGMLTCGILPVGAWLGSVIETRFERPAALPDRIDGIIALGGPEELIRTHAHGFPHVNQAAERLTEFVALARRFPDTRLVFAGGYGFIGEFPLAGADLARSLFEDLGLPADRVIFEDQSRNTRENAVFAKALVEPEAGENWLLVTSALHMTRSVGIFRQVDWPVIPWPVDYRHPSESASYPRFSVVDGLKELDAATRELIGLIYYRLRGWTDALVPAPEA